MLRRLVPFATILVQHRSLLWQFTMRNVEIRHKGSYLGIVWPVLNPLLMLGVYVLVFGYIFGGSFGRVGETRLDYGLTIFLGLTIFHFAAESLATAPGIIIANPNFVKKVVFPLEVLPAANVGAAAVHLLIGLALMLVGAGMLGNGLTATALWLPVIILPLVLLCLGLNWFFAALGVYLRDIGQLTQFLTLSLMFASAVFYPASRIPHEAWQFMRLNPFLIAIEQARSVVLWHEPARMNHMTYLYVSAFAACALGHLVFRRLKPGFADVL